jgi:hypothetical protein
MPTQQVLLLAVTRMRSGICVAGFTPEPDPVTGLRWVRPVRDFGTVQPGDMCDENECLFECGDVIALRLIEPRPDPPHVEDWLADFVYRRPRRLRRLEGDKRASFFRRYLDPAPLDVVTRCKRSLCLVEPSQVRAHFSLDAYSHKYEARMSLTFKSPGKQEKPAEETWHSGPQGITVTDLKWRALGKDWLNGTGGQLTLENGSLYERLHVEALYLAIGLSRSWKGRCWPLVVGVHTVPNYDAPADLSNAL